jgi:poly(3-hydroxybutyrate) depolymerase
MLTYLPDNLSPRPALVVVLHGSMQSAANYDRGAGWSALADRYGFALLMPEQSRKNNLTRSFNWFQAMILSAAKARYIQLCKWSR